MLQVKKILGIHGRSSTVEKSEGWITKKAYFESEGIVIDVPQFDASEDPTYESWEFVLKTLDFSQYDAILSSSHGGAVIAKYLKDNNIKIPRLVCVCPGGGNTPHKNTGRLYNEIKNSNINLESLVDEIIVIHSRDDEMVDFERGVAFAKQIGAYLIEADDFGHKFRGEDAQEFITSAILHGIKLAGCIALHNERGEYLLLQRENGIWTFPGGRGEPGEDFIDCVTRELQEETGIIHNDLKFFTCTITQSIGIHWKGKMFKGEISSDTPIQLERPTFSQYQFMKLQDFPPTKQFHKYNHTILKYLKGELEPRLTFK